MVDLSNMIEMVKYVLEQNHEARDSDILLQKVIHWNEYKKKGMEYNLKQRTLKNYDKPITHPIYMRDPNRVKGDLLSNAAKNNERIKA